jgi:hypothetical protein
LPDDAPPTRPWVRIDAALYSDARLIRAGFWACAVFPAVLMRAKLCGALGGRMSRDDLDPAVVARYMNGDAALGAQLAQGIAALEREGILVANGTSVQIAHWSRYQSDPTHAARQRKYANEKAKKDAGPSLTHPDVRDRQLTSADVTDAGLPTPSEAPGGARPDVSGRQGASVTLKRPNDGDVTGRDGTGRDEVPPTPLPPGDPDVSSTASSRVTPSEIAAMDAILTKQAAWPGSMGVPPNDKWAAAQTRQKLRMGALKPSEIRAFLRDNEKRYADTARAARAEVRRNAREARSEQRRAAGSEEGGDDDE